jgi:hypothetical protein
VCLGFGKHEEHAFVKLFDQFVTSAVGFVSQKGFELIEVEFFDIF